MKIEIEYTQLLQLLATAAKMQAVEQMVHSLPSYHLDGVLRAFFPKLPVEAETTEGRLH